MGAAATSGGLIIAFTILLLGVILGCTALVRFKNPDFWADSTAADLYKRIFRTVLLIVVGGIIAVTVAIPRWTRSSPSFSDSFIGQGMFETCYCSDPASFCEEQAAFRAVQGFSVLNLLALAGLTIVAAIGANMQVDEAAEANASQAPSVVGSTSPAVPPPHPGSRPQRLKTSDGNNDDDGEDVAGPAGAGTPGSSLPNLLCLVLFTFVFVCTFLSWIIFAGRDLQQACASSLLFGRNLGGTELSWGWVFRFFEWIFITIAAIVFVLTSRKFVVAFDFTMSRVHIVSLLLFCMSALSTTTASWAKASEAFHPTNFTTEDSVLSVGAFFGCRCGKNPRCNADLDAQIAAIFLYIVFFVVFTLRGLFVIGHSEVWRNALGLSLCDKVDSIETRLPRKASGIVGGALALVSPVLLLAAILLTTGVLTSENCGLSSQTADFGLVLSVIALFLCCLEGFVAFLDNVMPIGGFPDDPVPFDDEENTKNNNEGGNNTSSNRNNNNNDSAVSPPKQTPTKNNKEEEEKSTNNNKKSRKQADYVAAGDETGNIGDQEMSATRESLRRQQHRQQQQQQPQQQQSEDNSNFSGINENNNNNNNNNNSEEVTPRNNRKFKPPQFNNPYANQNAAASTANNVNSNANTSKNFQHLPPPPPPSGNKTQKNNNNNNNNVESANNSSVASPPKGPKKTTSTVPPPPPGPPPISHAIAVVEVGDE